MQNHDLIARPSEHYADPQAAIADPKLDAGQKERLLANWHDEVVQRQRAEQEGLDGGEAAHLLGALRAAESLSGETRLGAGTRKLAGVFPGRREAESARDSLARGNAHDARISVIGPDQSVSLAPDPQQESAALRDESVRGGAAGAGAMAAGLGALSVVDVVVAAPIALTLAGLGGALGSVAGTLASHRLRDPEFLELVREAQSRGHWLLLVEIGSEGGALAMQDALARTAARETIDHGGARQTVGH